MSDVTADLRATFEDAGYAVEDVGDNRGQIRITLREDGADVEELRTLTEDVCGEDAVLGFDVTAAETAEDEVGTAVSFRYRP